MSGSEPQSPRPAMPLWLIVMTLLGGAFLLQRGKYPGDDQVATPPAVVTARAIGAEASDSEHRLRAPLREFLGLPSRPSPEADDLATRIENSVGLLEFLIVSVADPIDTATNYRFDLQIDTLHKALGADGYVPDQYYLPWAPPEKDNASFHRTEPGVLLYRRNGASKSACPNPNERHDLLLVYLVGETPTSGIHKTAFLAAVRQIHALGKLAPFPEPGSRSTIRVAGTVFTGAADSLAVAIRQACAEMEKEESASKQVEFEVITGTALSIDRKRFEDLAGAENVDLHSTVLPGNVLRQALIDHVVERTWKKLRIAWLTETATGYGSSISTRDKAIESQPKAEIVEFRFPINISKVRSGYAESRRRERSGQMDLGPETSRLRIPFDDTSTARDVPPMQTPQITAPTAELILGQILTAIRSSGIRYVGISSSDSRDAIFLAELIQEQCPDVQLMLVGSDVLYLHPEYRSIMHGTLVASPYPLHPEALDLCFPFGETQDGNSRSIVLSSLTNYGLYNAVLFLRGLERGQYKHDHHADNNGNHQHASHNLLTLSYLNKNEWPGGFPVGYSMPFEVNVGKDKLLRPPVWISRVASTGFCPITVRETDLDGKSDYTFHLQIANPPAEAPPLPVARPRSRIPASLNIASLAWLVVAAIYCAALLIPKSLGNWAKALAMFPEHSEDFQALRPVFRSLITGSFVSVLMLFGTLLRTYYRRVGSDLGDSLTLVLFLLCYGMSAILILCLLADWVRAFVSLADDLIPAAKRLIMQARSGAAPADAGIATPQAEPNMSWHLIAARAIGLTMILALVAIYLAVAFRQNSDWWQLQTEAQRYHPDAFLWFMRNSDLWNGLSPAMTAQLQAVVLIILAYGMLLQIHLLSPEFTIIRPDPSTSAPPSPEDLRQRQEEVRSALLFPLLSRWRRNRPVVLDLLCVAAALLWLGFLGVHVQGVDHFSKPISFPTTLLLVAGGFWCVRQFKLLLILNGLAQQLDELTSALRQRWPADWPKIFELLPEQPAGLQELFWASRPTVNDRELSKARQAVEEDQPEAQRPQAERKLCAIEIDLYIRQYFHHIVRLGRGLAVAACLLFLSAHSFPFSQEPLVRLWASVMLAAIGCVLAWYYLKFDRNELLSHLVGTDPKRVSINWSLIQTVAPAVLLTAIALLSQTFPGIWQWMRSVLEPMANSSL